MEEEELLDSDSSSVSDDSLEEFLKEQGEKEERETAGLLNYLNLNLGEVPN